MKEEREGKFFQVRFAPKGRGSSVFFPIVCSPDEISAREWGEKYLLHLKMDPSEFAISARELISV